MSPRLTVVYGVRNDYDSFTGDVDVAPRGSFTASLTSDGRTMLRGGAGLFYTPLPLNVAVFDQLQSRTITQFDAEGVRPVGITTLRNTDGRRHPDASQRQRDGRTRPGGGEELLRPPQRPAAQDGL